MAYTHFFANFAPTALAGGEALEHAALSAIAVSTMHRVICLLPFF
ncbi:hypothetical protein XCR_3921 [Xanthomonas campestris pv. raphani 756C]|nr:hypothetical protein XCR_3921 [Xanthomonas campestris pv. raphani 756C]